MGVPVTGTIVPTDIVLDTYAVIDPIYGIDGLRSVADTTARNAITALRRRAGMVVYVQADSLYWRLNPSPWAFDNTDWTLFAAGLTFISPACRVATTGALTVTYANGTLGVGATLTNAGVQAAISIDGVSLSVADVVLVKNQAAPAQNGIYTVTTVGTGATNWVLTRATNYDQQAEIVSGSYAVIGAGTANTGTLWVMTGTTPITVGTTAITFTQLTLTGSGSVTSVATGTGLTGGPITTTGTIALATIADHTVLANISGGALAPSSTTLTALIDNAISATQGVILYRGASAWSALAVGTTGQVLATQGAAANPQWITPVSGTVTSVATGTGLTGGTITTTGTISLAAIADHTVLANISGGSLAPSSTTLTALIDNAIGSTQGVILYRGASTWSALAVGTSGQVLATQGAAANPQWITPVAGTVTSVATGTGLTGGTITTTGTIAMATGTINTLAGYNGSGVFSGVTVSTGLSLSSGVLTATGSGGTVTSVATGAGLTGGTITSTGTIALATIANQTVLANVSGGALAPSSTTLTALIDSAIGSTQGNILYRGASTWTALANGTSGQVLATQGASANPHWITAGTGTVTSVATDATLTGGTITTTGTLGIATSAAIPGSPTTTTQSSSDNSTRIATTAFVATAIANYIPTGPHAFVALMGIGADITTGTNSANTYSIAPFAGTFTRWDVAIPTANQPSGASLVIDVLKSSNHGSTWTSLWASNPGNRPTVTTGTNNAGGTAFDTTTFSAGDWLRYDVITAGGGTVQNVNLTVSSRMNQ